MCHYMLKPQLALIIPWSNVLHNMSNNQCLPLCPKVKINSQVSSYYSTPFPHSSITIFLFLFSTPQSPLRSCLMSGYLLLPSSSLVATELSHSHKAIRMHNNKWMHRLDLSEATILHIFQGVRLISNNEIYFWIDIHRIALWSQSIFTNPITCF